MQLVNKPTFWPSFCAVTGNAEDHGGFVDTLNEIPPNPAADYHVYVSRGGFKQLAEAFGYPDPDAIEQMESRIAELESDNEDLLQHKEHSEEVYAAIETLENHGYAINTKEPA